MASADVSALVDMVTAVDTPETPSTSEPTTSVDTETPETTTPDAEQTTPESDTPETAEAPQSQPEAPIDGRTNPAAIRSALKAFRDSSPENAPLARALNDGMGRYLAYKDSFATVADARNAKAFLEANGGIEGLTSLHETIKSVNDTDALLYSGDPRLFDSIIEDLRAENKLDSFTKLGPAFLDKLRTVDEKGYFNVIKPHFYQGLVDTGVPNVVSQLAKYLSGDTPNLEGAKGLLTEMSNWLNGLRDSVERTDKSKLDPDRQAFEKERSDFQSQKTKEFQTGVANEAENYNNTSLGGALKPFLNKPYFKNLRTNQASMISLAREVKSTLMEELSADKTYKTQMDAFFAQKTPDKSRIVQYHKAKVDTMAQRIAKQVIERRWPDYDKRTGPAAAAKPAAPAAPASQTPGKPEFVKSKPTWEQLDMDKDPGRMLYITGKGYLKSSGKLITWNPKYK